MIQIEVLVAEFEEAQKKAARLRAELQDVDLERMALQQLIVARGGQNLLKSKYQLQFKERQEQARDAGSENSAESQASIILSSLPPRGQTFTVDQILKEARLKSPTVGRQAVTFNLWKLTKRGIVKVVTPGRGRREGSYVRS